MDILWNSAWCHCLYLLPLPHDSYAITGKDIAWGLPESRVNQRLQLWMHIIFLDMSLSRSSWEQILWPPYGLWALRRDTWVAVRPACVSWAWHTPCSLCPRPSVTSAPRLGVYAGWHPILQSHALSAQWSHQNHYPLADGQLTLSWESSVPQGRAWFGSNLSCFTC